jgi:hypothetical protein
MSSPFAVQEGIGAERELTFAEVVEKYPQIPRLIVLKIDARRRGVHYTEEAFRHVDPSQHQVRGKYIFGARDGALTPVPESLILRDGTTVLTDPTPLELNPYVVDWHDGQFVLRDGEEILEEVELWSRPAYYGKKTSRGTAMEYVLTARPQRLNLFVANYCHFWTDKHECRFCDIVTHLKQQKQEWNIPSRVNADDVEETLREALKEPGRFANLYLTAGSDMHGDSDFDREVDYYIEVLQAAGRVFEPKKFPCQLMSSAFTEKQLSRIYEETGVSSYVADTEVLNERLFNWICPGKSKWVGYREWKRRLIAAVDIFGRGNVGTGVVGGVELAQPFGFASEDDALNATLEEAEDLTSHGVSTVFIVWTPRPGSHFHDQKIPSLEYYVRLALGLHRLRARYGLGVDFDDYRRCGNHPDSDLARLL